MRRHPRHVEAKAGLRKLRSRATLGCCLAVAGALAAAGCAASSAAPGADDEVDDDAQPAAASVAAIARAAITGTRLIMAPDYYTGS